MTIKPIPPGVKPSPIDDLDALTKRFDEEPNYCVKRYVEDCRSVIASYMRRYDGRYVNESCEYAVSADGIFNFLYISPPRIERGSIVRPFKTKISTSLAFEKICQCKEYIGDLESPIWEALERKARKDD